MSPAHTMGTRLLFKCFLITVMVAVIATFLLFIITGNMDITADYFYEDAGYKPSPIDPDTEAKILKKKIPDPIILWWTPFTGDRGTVKRCGNVQCFFTVDRHYTKHSKTQAFIFYGTDFRTADLPLPRNLNHQWALLHEESPKNNYLFSHQEIMSLFNHTSTFRRESGYPITTQYLESLKWLESKKYMVSITEKNKILSELSPLVYTHSDCGTPSDRDSYVKLLMEYLNVDSYGVCLHNKDLPDYLQDAIKGMDHEDFYRLNAKYKFSLAFENGICNDYITEKLWRPLMVGSLPIVMGSPKVKDFLPSNHSAIVVDDFGSVKELAEYINFLNSNDEEYEKYFEWKRKGVSNDFLKKIMSEREWSTNEAFGSNTKNFIEGFECYVCKRIHENNKRIQNGQRPLTFQADVEHYGCPNPVSFDGIGKRTVTSEWEQDWKRSKYLGIALRRFIDKKQNYSNDDLSKLASTIQREDLK